MSRLLVLTALFAAVAFLSTRAPETASQVRAADAPAKTDPKVERGKYLAHDVALCVYCHSARTIDGQIIKTELFQGAPVPVPSPFPNQEWASKAPNLMSIAEVWGEKDLVKFLQTGIPPRGAPPRLPMPPFRMNEEDASAVAAYLRSLR
ncbi:c-type cytochrome [Planctomicrobium piriforme]|nr:cytochrome c [Planctomicrobium piriforme]